MNLHVVAYPVLSPADHEMIQAVRRDHNTLHNIIGPHFTIVFSVPDVPLPDFASEIKKRAAAFTAIPFCIRCATINKDFFSDNYDAFLVPDEGFSGIAKLHDMLYSDTLARHHRLDIPYIPHISIANSPDPLVTKKIVDDWNAQRFAINGTISALDIVNYENRVITTMERIELLPG